MRQILQSYLRRLTNLSGNNRSLLLMRLISDQFIDLHHFDFLNNKPSFSIIEELIGRKSSIVLCPAMDVREEWSNKVSQQLKKLQRTEKFIYDERGSKDLYVGWPFVRGRFADGTLVRCPLLFFPVDLTLENNNWHLSLRPDVSLSLNKSFLLAYGYYNNMKLEEDLLEYNLDKLDKDSRIFRTALYQLFKSSPVEINFNQENFIDKLVSFENFKKADFELEQKAGELKLFPESVLGIFPQAGSYLVPDYLNLIENGQVQDIEAFFHNRSVSEDKHSEENRPDAFQYLAKVKEEQTFTPFKMDAFQENAIKAVKRGNSLVIQGPPGTGKSQLICNLMADFIARGKRVLVVCQKKAALDVVYKRLREMEAADFVALVHDFKNDRKSIYQQIDKQIGRIPDYKQKNNSLNAIHLERQFLQASRRIDQLTEELDEFRQALFDTEECGLSVKELYLSSDIDAKAINIKQEYRRFPFSEVDEFLRKLNRYTTYAQRILQEGHPWRERRSFKDYGTEEYKHLKKLIADVPLYQQDIAKRTEEIIEANMELFVAASIADTEDTILQMLELLRKGQAYSYFQHFSNFNGLETDALWLANMERVLIDCYKGEGPELSLDTEDLGNFQEVLQKRMELKRNFFKFLRWTFFSGEKFFLKRVLAANNLPNNKKGFHILIDKIDNRLNLEHNLTKLKEEKWLTDIPTSYEKIDFQNWFYYQKRAIEAKYIFALQRNFKEYFNVKLLTFSELERKITALLQLFQPIPAKIIYWQEYLTPAQLNMLLYNESGEQKLQKALQTDFEAICEFDRLIDELPPEEALVIERLKDATGDAYHDVIPLFQNSLRLAWIDHIETKFPVLRTVTSQKLEMLEEELQGCVGQKLQVSKDILLLKARERTYQDVEYNRLNNMVTYRDLQHQVSKKRNVWPLRKLLASFSGELFNLVPCWMASPESVSAMFPMEQLFDIVIFDEASQCFAEKGIPAMYRGNQVVITGDDKQLSPFDLYRVRWEDEMEDQPALEVDSLLGLAQQHLMQVQLRGHYRSRSLELIDFSNQHFYGGKLKLLPDFQDMNSEEPALKYIKVDGIWENSSNDLEARKVVELTEKLLKSQPGKEIGIVTFNASQQGHIMDMLEKAALENNFKIPETLFVKNIENVQGDEKDIIIFSIAYAPDKTGKMMMQFGSLNIEKGENRLNVAITRAREAIYVISSIYPQQLKVEESKNEGPGLLKKYLEYVLDVSEENYKATLPSLENVNINWFLKHKLLENDYSIPGTKLLQEVPFADLTIKVKNKYTGVILTDDDLYHQSASVKEPHIYLPFSLRNKKWKYKKFYSREYWHDKAMVREKIMRFMAQSENDH